jgi:hypothetical protein
MENSTKPLTCGGVEPQRFLGILPHATQASCPNHTPYTPHIKTRKHLTQHNTTKTHHPSC